MALLETHRSFYSKHRDNFVAVYAAVIFASLPTAQNVFNYANRYQRGRTIATNATFVTTVAALPLVVVISLLLDA